MAYVGTFSSRQNWVEWFICLKCAPERRPWLTSWATRLTCRLSFAKVCAMSGIDEGRVGEWLLKS